MKSSLPRRARGARPEVLALGAIGRSAALRDVLDLPPVTELLLDDVCLQVALLNLVARKPRWWQRSSFGAWRQESALLEVERHRLTAEATRLSSWLTTNTAERPGTAEPTD